MIDKYLMPLVAGLNVLGAVTYFNELASSEATPKTVFLAVVFTATSLASLGHVGFSIYNRSSK